MSKKQKIQLMEPQEINEIDPSLKKEQEEEMYNLEHKILNALFSQWWNGELVPKVKEDSGVYLSDEEKKQEFLNNTLINTESIKEFQKKQKEDMKQNPEKYLKQLFKSNLDMKKIIATQSLAIKVLEKENKELNHRLTKELDKTILERLKEFVAKIFKRGQNV
jgi:hypothetical protein